MPISMHSASVPVFKQLLGALSHVLEKAAAHAAAHKIDATVLLNARLYPDMFPLVRQVQVATDFARGISARLCDAEPLVVANTHASFEDLVALIASTCSFLDTLDAAQMLGSETLEIVLRPGTPKEKRLLGANYLMSYGLPQFYFHVTTSYAILRHSGVELGKRDYMGVY
jgi:uncharacterized protein